MFSINFIQNPAVASGLSPVIWSGAIGAIVALFSGILLALFNAWHSSKEKDRDRIIALRKEVYLPFVASIPGLWSSLSKLPSTPQYDEKAVSEFITSVNKLAAVAEPETAVIATKLSTTITVKLLELMIFASPAQQSHSDANIAKEYRIKANLKADLIQSKIDEFLQSGEISDLKFEAMRRTCRHYNEQTQQYWKTENEALIQYARHTIEFTRQMISVIPELESMRLSLLLSLRRDIGLKNSSAEFEDSVKAQSDILIASLEKTISLLEQQITSPS